MKKAQVGKVKRFLNDIPVRLTRVTSSGRYLPAVDGLRFMAIMPVLVQHLSERFIRYGDLTPAVPVNQDYYAFLAGRGTIGVFLFFAISGFILGLPFAKHFTEKRGKLQLRRYLWRRITRLEPPYILWMCCFFFVLLIKGDYSFKELFPHLGASLFYLHNVLYEQYSWINPVAWSLEIEIQFYLSAPFLAGLFFSIPSRTRRRVALLSAIAGMIAAQHAFGWLVMPYKATLLGQLQHFLSGFLMADLYLSGWLERRSRRSLLWDLAGLAAFWTLLHSWSTVWTDNLLFAGALLLFFAAGFKGRSWRRLLSNRWIAATGGMCYTIYLIHLPLLEGLVRWTGRITIGHDYGINLLVQMLLAFPVVLGISAVAFLLFEKPFMDKNWPQKVKDRWTAWRSRNWTIKKATS